MNTTRLENREAARTMFAIASLLEAQGANPYRVRAYRRAALQLMRLPEQAADFTSAEGQLLVPWLGDRLRHKVGELVSRGKMQFHQELLADFPRAFRQLMAVPGVGPKMAERLIREMEIKSVLGLARAARQGRLQRARGFGPVLEHRLGEAAERRSSRTRRKTVPQLELPTELHGGHERGALRPAA